jgi:MFS family permease
MASSNVRAIVRVSSGNFLEMYDFMVFGYYAPAIGAAFFPSGNQFVSLMLALMTFGAGFLMRPLGAIVLGAYADRYGRRAGLVLTLSLMSVGIVSIACVPGYATIGILAPLLVLSGRLLQGFSAGMELGGFIVQSESPRQGTKGSTWPGNPRASKPRWCSRRFSASC